MENDNQQTVPIKQDPDRQTDPFAQPIQEQVYEKKSKKKSMVVVVSIVIFLALSVPVILYLFANYSDTGDELSGVKFAENGENVVYTNQQHQFSIEYPKDFQIRERPQPLSDSIIFSLTGDDDSVDSAETVFIGLSIGKKQSSDIYYGSYTWTKEIVDELKNVQAGGVGENESDLLHKKGTVFIDGLPWVVYEAEPKATGEGIFPSYNVAMEHEDKTYLFSASTRHIDQTITLPPNTAMIDKIISSFKLK